MSSSRKTKHYAVGRGRPPKPTQWKPGQTGNPKRIRNNKPLDLTQMIELALQRTIQVTEGDRRRRMSVFEAIVIQLWAAAVRGNSRARRVLLEYRDFAASKGGFGGVEIRFEGEDEA